MDLGIEGTGIVTKVTANYCEISADIDGSKHTLTVSRNIFYAFGIRCEAQLTNLLEEGTEINICYTNEYQSKPVVTVARLGEKPELDQLKPVMEDVYDQSGRICHVLVDVGYFVESDKLPYRIKVSKEVVYRNGCPNKVDLVVGDGVKFDAVPVELDSDFKYQATCAWIGREPRIVDRFGLDICESLDVLDDLSETRFYGTVVVVPNDVVAFVKVEMKEMNESVMLFRSSFDRTCERIQDIVRVGDSLCMHLSFRCIFRGCRQWFAVKARRNNPDQNDSEANSKVFDKGTEVDQPVLSNLSTSCSRAFIDKKEATKEGFKRSTARGVTENPDMFVTISKPVPTERSKKPDTFLCSNNEKVLFSDPPLRGSFSRTSFKRAVITYEGMEIDLTLFCLFRDSWSCNLNSVRRSTTDVETVYFEAIPRDSFILTEQRRRPYYASLAWVDEKPSLDIVAMVAQGLGPKGSSTDIPMIVLRRNERTYVGNIFWIYLPDDALILLYLGGNRVIVRLNKGEFDGESRPGQTPPFITDYVYFKEIVSFKIRQDDQYCGGLCAYDVVKSTEDDLIAFRNDSKDWTFNLVDEPLFEQDLRAFDVIITINAKYEDCLLRIVAETPHLFSNIIDPGYKVKRDFRPKLYVGDSVDSDFISGEDKKVLFADPPLSGKVIWSSTKKAVILFDGFKIDVPACSVPRDKVDVCSDKSFKTANTAQTVHFEAIPRIVSREGLNPYYATLAWLGKKKPGLLSISRSVECEPILIWRFTDRTFVGKVIRFSMPNDALIQTEIRGELTVACLHKSAFLRMFEFEKTYISDYVHFGQYVEFKIKPNSQCRVGVCAYNVVKSSADTYWEFCERSMHWTV